MTQKHWISSVYQLAFSQHPSAFAFVFYGCSEYTSSHRTPVLYTYEEEASPTQTQIPPHCSGLYNLALNLLCLAIAQESEN